MNVFTSNLPRFLSLGRLAALAALLLSGLLPAAPAKEPRKDRYGDPLPPGAIARLVNERLRGVCALAFTPDGRHVVSRADKGIFAWEARTGRLLHRWHADKKGAEYLLTLLPDGRLLTADPSPDPRQGHFRLRDSLTGREVWRFEGRPDVGPPVFSIAPGGRFAGLRGRAGEFCILEARTGLCRYRVTLTPVSGGLWLSADGDTLVWHRAAAGASEIHILRQPAKKPVIVRVAPDDLEFRLISSSCLSPDGRWFVVPTNNGRLRRWDMRTGKEAPPLDGTQRTVWDLFWSPDGRIVGAGGSAAPRNLIDPEAQQDTRFWDAATGKRLSYLDLPSRPTALLFSPDSRTLITADLDGVIHLREVITGKERCHFKGHLAGAVNALAVSPDGRLLASGGQDSQVLVWSLTGQAGTP